MDAASIRQLEDWVNAMGTAADEIALSELHANFHKMVIHCSGHKRIVEILDGLWSQMNLLLTVTHFGHLEQATVQHDHRLLLEVLKEGDATQARWLFEEHISRTLPGLMESLDQELQPTVETENASEPRGAA